MADKDARVRLNLAAAGFLTAMQQLQKQGEEFAKAVEGIGDASEKSNRKTSGFFAAVKAGAGGAARGVSELGQHLKSVLTTAATLGGSLSIGAAVHESRALVSSYKDLAFQIRAGTGQAISYQQIQERVEATAARWGRRNGEVAASMKAVYEDIGDPEYAAAAAEEVAKAATATGAPMSALNVIAGQLNEKFGITAKELPDAMAAAVAVGSKGGVSVEDMGEKIGMLGASAKLAGLQGKAGFQQTMGMVNLADGATGNLKKTIGSVTQLFDQMIDPATLEKSKKELKLDLIDKSTGNLRSDATQRLLAKTGGKREELAKVFMGDPLKLLVDLGKTYAATFDETKGSIRDKTAAGLDAFDEAVRRAGKQTLTAEDMQKQALERRKDAERNLDTAMNDFVKAFERPEVVHAVDQLAAQAPRLAATLGRLVEFTAAHPAAAAAAVVGGYAAKGALTAVVTKISDEAMDRGGKLLGKGLEGSWSAGGKVAGAAFVVAAGAAGYEIGKQLADYFLNKDQARLDKTGDLASTAEAMVKHGTGTPEQRKQAAAALRAQIADMEKEGPSTYTETIGAYAAKFAGDPELDPRVQRARAIANAKAQLAALEGSKPAPTLPDVTNPPTPAPAAAPSAASRQIASEVARGDGKVTISNEQAMAAAIARATAAMTLNVRVIDGGGNGSNGLPPAPGNNSGSTPR